MVRPNLRQTIIIGIVIFILAFGGIALLSLSNINQLQQEVVLVERADDLRNLILEIRREEKNFFLYQDTSLFSVGKENLGQATAILGFLSEGFAGTDGEQRDVKLAQGIRDYASFWKRSVLPPLKSAGTAPRRVLFGKRGRGLSSTPEPLPSMSGNTFCASIRNCG